MNFAEQLDQIEELHDDNAFALKDELCAVGDIFDSLGKLIRANPTDKIFAEKWNENIDRATKLFTDASTLVAKGKMNLGVADGEN